MTASTTRRSLLVGSAVIGTGLALGAFTRASLAAMPLTMSEKAFLDRFDHRLDNASIRDLLVGNTMEGVTFKGDEFLAYIAPDGAVDKIIGDRRDSGKWQIENDEFSMEFKQLAGGKPFSLRVFQFKDSNLFKGWSPTEKRWAWFVVEPGKAKELA
jgi:hypothetical protein